MSPHASLLRYTPIIASPDQFLAALTQPLDLCIWRNPHRVDQAKLESYLATMGNSQPVLWQAGGYRIQGWDKPGRSLSFRCGWYAIHEEIAMTAVKALDPQPGDRILDLCAAPGGKTAHLSWAVGDRGMVMANERSISRLASLWSTITRLGLTNVLTSAVDGRTFPGQPHSFDRVLVDVPCSGEGTIRKKAARYVDRESTLHPLLEQSNWNETHSRRLGAIQRQLLDRALTLVKPGGVVVYSTCTFAPEENEAVLDAIVGDRGILEPFTISPLRVAPGLTAWQGQSFRSDLIHAHRYWPHLNNTGGFFAARIRRTAHHLVPNPSDSLPITASDERPPRSGTVNPAADRAALEWMGDRFGISDRYLTPYTLWATGQEKEWIAGPGCLPPPHVPVQTIGLPLTRRTPHGFKPTTAALQFLGAAITRQYVMLDLPHCQQFLMGESQWWNDSSSVSNGLDFDGLDADEVGTLNAGFVHVRHGAYDIGCGRWKQGQLHCELPKALRSPSSGPDIIL